MYITVSEADTKYASRLPISLWVSDQQTGDETLMDIWDEATEDTKARALGEAARIIDSFDYDGYKTADDQSGEFPRNGKASIPKEVKEATFELALVLLRRMLILDTAEPYIARGKYYNAEQVNTSVAESRDQYIFFRDNFNPYKVIHPYLKRWLKGRFRSVEYV